MQLQTPFPQPDISSPSNIFEKLSFIISISVIPKTQNQTIWQYHFNICVSVVVCVSLWRRERELKPDIAEPCFSNSYHHPSGVSLSFSLPLELVQSGTFSFLKRPTQWRWWRWLRATVTLFLFLMPCHLRCQKKYQSLNCSQGALLQSKPQMFQSQPHFACTVHFLSSMPSFFSIKTSIAALPSSRKPGESHKNRVVHHHAIVLKLRLRGQKPETSSVVLFYF